MSFDSDSVSVSGTSTAGPAHGSSAMVERQRGDRVVLAEVRAAAGIGLTRAAAWAALAEDDGISHDDVRERVNFVLHEVGMVLDEIVVAAEVALVAAACQEGVEPG